MKIKLRVIPNSSISRIEKLSEDNYKVHLNSAPVDGKANAELLKLVSKYFKVCKSCIRISRGTNSKDKIIEIDEH